MMGDPFSGRDLPNIWEDVTAEEFHQVCETGCLTPRLKEKLCRMMDVQNVPDGNLQVLINHEDLEYMPWDEWKKRPEIFARKPPRPKNMRDYRRWKDGR
jgi:hypothetical protein